MIAGILFFLGIFIGSFLNVVIDRVPRGEKFLTGRSHCDFCHHTLSWYDLFPLFSFLLAKGRCRYCKEFIGWKYPTIEVTTGILFAFTYLFFQQNSFPAIAAMLAIVSCLIVIFFTDLFSGIIPDVAVGTLVLFAILRVAIFHLAYFPFLLSGGAAGAFFVGIFLFTRGRGIGFGDVKYAFAMGLLLGFPLIITGLYVAFLTGAGVALILVIAKEKTMRQTIAFGPFLVLGTCIHLFWGLQLWTFFQKILGI